MGYQRYFLVWHLKSLAGLSLHKAAFREWEVNIWALHTHYIFVEQYDYERELLTNVLACPSSAASACGHATLKIGWDLLKNLLLGCIPLDHQ